MRTKVLFTPLFTFFFYSHNPEEYEKLREKLHDRWFKDLGYDSENRSYYEKYKKESEEFISRRLEREYPTPLYWNDIAGFIEIIIENPIGSYKIIGRVWSIKSRKIKAKRIFRPVYGDEGLIDKELIDKPDDFNKQFFEKVENVLNMINEDYLRPKKFYFLLDDNRFNWDLIKTSDIAGFLKDLGPNWIY
jgi:hypothetical protein